MTTFADQPDPMLDPTLVDLMVMVDALGHEQANLVRQIDPRELDTVDPGGWTTRQVLSHVIGSWQRVPVWASFFLDGDPSTPVPIYPHDPFWMREWETAPLAAFTLTLRAAVAGNQTFLQMLDAPALARTHPTPFGEMTLVAFLMFNYQLHLGKGHTPQLQALLHTSSSSSR